MPQISQLPEFWASQVFWTLLIFGFVFFVIGRGMVPKVMATVALRDKQIADDLASADKARKAAEAEEEAWRKRDADNRAQSQAIIASAKADASKATEGSLAEVNARLDAQIADAEARIAAARANAMVEIENVAAEAASDIVSRLAGVTVDPAVAQAAVKEALHA